MPDDHMHISYDDLDGGDSSRDATPATPQAEPSGHVGLTCPYCQGILKPREQVIVCPSCGTAHHEGCWQENGGCTTVGCQGRGTAAPQTPAAPWLLAFFPPQAHHTDLSGGKVVSSVSEDMAEIVVSALNAWIQEQAASGQSRDAVAAEAKRIGMEQIAKQVLGENWTQEYLGQTGQGGLVIGENVLREEGDDLLFRCGRCRWHWIPASRAERTCPRCNFSAPVRPYVEKEDRQAEPAEDFDALTSRIADDIRTFLNMKPKQLERKFRIIPGQMFQNLLKLYIAAQAEKISLEQMREGLKNNISHFTAGKKWKDMIDSCDNLRIHFPSVYDHASTVWTAVRNAMQDGHNKSSCFVATAVFGDAQAPEVCALRWWRDRVLTQHLVGRAFVSAYYRVGPIMARLVVRWPALRPTLRRLLARLSQRVCTNDPAHSTRPRSRGERSKAHAEREAVR